MGLSINRDPSLLIPRARKPRLNTDRSSCVPNTPTAMEVWSYVGDEGRPLGADDQESASNHRELLS